MPVFRNRLFHPACLVALGVLLMGSVGFAAPRSRWLAQPWQTEDGLPNNTVAGVAQTPDGYLWLGTPTGLVRFDGANFEGFSSTNFVAAPNRGILSLIGLRGGGLFLAMDRGALVVLQPNFSRAFLPGRDVPDEVPYAMAEEAQGALWVSYRGGSVCRIDGDKVTRFTETDGLPGPVAMCALTTDRAGQIWFARGRNFGMIRDGQFQTLHQLPSPFTRLAGARDGGIWISSGTRLLKCDGTNVLQDLGEFSSERSGTAPTALLEDQSGFIWIGTAYRGLFHFDGSSFERVPTSHQEVMCVAEDSEGNVWVGTTGGGLNQVRPRVVDLEGIEDGLPFNAVQSLCEDTNGVLWAATQNGALARRVGERWQAFLPATGWSAEATCVAADAAGALWIGTRVQGIFCWKDGRLQEWGDPGKLKGRTIHALQATRMGDLWIGEDTPNALQRLRGGVLQDFNVPSDELRVIRAMTEGADGSVWVGTSRGLLFRGHEDGVSDETAATTGEPTSIRCLYTSPDGTVWIGYAGWGLGRLRDGHFTFIRTEQGLFDDYISHIVEDGHGWLWFGGDRGVFKVRQQELDDVAEGRIRRVRSIHYGGGEGLPSLQGNFGGAPGAVRTRDGRIWIPMRTGLAVVHPDRLRENSEPPAVLLERVIVDERTVAAYAGLIPTPESRDSSVLDLRSRGTELRLPPGHRRVSFAFTATSFSAPENVRFRYYLEGDDDDWGIQVRDRTVSYTRLAAGSYKFRVIACNSDGVWNETGAALSLVVLPFFWQTWWFRSSVLIAFTAIVIAIVRYVSFRRLRAQLITLEQQAALHKERARIAKDIHDDLGANLTQISLIGELAHQDRETPDKVSTHLDKISGTARQAIKSLDEIVWAVNPRNDTLAHFIDYTGQFALDYLRVAGLRCRLDLPEQVPARELSTDLRHNLFLVVKEAINNTVKHAHATELRLQVSVTDDKLAIVIEDNGQGFHQESADAGADGLRNMRQRLADIGGSCWIQGRPGAGVKVAIEITWTQIKS